MKRFVIKVIGFAVLVVGIIGGVWFSEILAEVRVYRLEVVAPESASILLCSDSQLGNSIDPAIAPEFFNFCAHGRTFDQQYFVMKDVLDAPENKGRIKKVVIDVAPSSLAWLAENPIDGLGFAGKYYLIHLLHWREASAIRKMDGWLKVSRDNLVGRRLRHFWRSLRGKDEFCSSMCGKYTPYYEQLLIDSPSEFEFTVKDKINQGAKAEIVDADGFYFQIMRKIIQAAKDRDVEIVFVTTPWHEKLIKAYGEKKIDIFEKLMTNFANEYGLRYVNFLRNEFPNDAWMDANHLNVKGSAIFTPIFASAINEDK